MDKPDLREVRLPQWAQETLRALRNEVEILQGRVAEYEGKIDKTNTYLEDYLGVGNRKLPNEATIEFHAPFHDRPDDHARVHVRASNKVQYGRAEGLYVQALDGTLMIEPQAANVIRVLVRRR